MIARRKVLYFGNMENAPLIDRSSMAFAHAREIYKILDKYVDVRVASM